MKKWTTLPGESMIGIVSSRKKSFSIKVMSFVTKHSKTEKKCKMHHLLSRQSLKYNNYEKMLAYLTFMASSASSHWEQNILSLLVMVIVESFVLTMCYLPYLFPIFRYILHWIFSFLNTLGRKIKHPIHYFASTPWSSVVSSVNVIFD